MQLCKVNIYLFYNIYSSLIELKVAASRTPVLALTRPRGTELYQGQCMMCLRTTCLWGFAY